MRYTAAQIDVLRHQAYLKQQTLYTLAKEDPAVFCAVALRDERTGAHIHPQPFHLQWFDLLRDHRRFVLWAPPETGKAVPLDTPIPTPDGWREMGGLQAGDLVFGKDGKPYPILAATETQYEREVYELEFDDGVRVRADADHRWLARTREDRLQERPWREVATRQMLQRVMVEGDTRAKWSMPLPGPVQYPETELPIPPYVLGAWLGDGTAQSSELNYHPRDFGIVERCDALVGCGRPYERRTCWAVTLGPKRAGGVHVREELRALNLIENKHIPGAYLCGSTQQRLELLRGLLDTDGAVSSKHPSVEFSTSYPRLRDGVLELVRSLGIKVSCTRKPTYRRDSWRIRFTPPEDVRVFWLDRKQERLNERPPTSGRSRQRFVRAIRPVPSVPVRCISVASPDRTYVMGRDYVTTHNTQLISIGYLIWLLGKNPRGRYAILAATSSQGERAILAIQEHITNNPVVAAVFPNLRRGPIWSSSQMTVLRPEHGIAGPSIQAFGVDQGSIQGRRLDGIIIDDILTETNTRTAHQRARIDRYVRSSAFSRLGEDGFAIFLANAWHPQDMAHELEREGWVARRYPIVDEDTGQCIWPTKFPPSRLEEIKATLGPLEYARQMLCRPRDDSTSRFKRAWIEGCLERGRGRMRRDFGIAVATKDTEAYTGVDLGVGQSAQHDLTSIFTFLLHPNEDRELVRLEAGRWSGPEIVRKVIETHTRFQSMVFVEDNAAQDYIRQFATAQTAIPVRGLTTTSKRKHSVQFGVESIATELYNRKWILPCSAQGVPDEEVGNLIQEMLYYDPAGHTGDRLMSMWIAREGMRTLSQRIEYGNMNTLRR